jgi:hypothetical protein
MGHIRTIYDANRSSGPQVHRSTGVAGKFVLIKELASRFQMPADPTPHFVQDGTPGRRNVSTLYFQCSELGRGNWQVFVVAPVGGHAASFSGVRGGCAQHSPRVFLAVSLARRWPCLAIVLAPSQSCHFGANAPSNQVPGGPAA